ncbi:MAG: hypothetical protein HQM12_17585, partial [SAR324 cluster bacterium]|nr:hypothetical protein [SAR324 cluster bacterium]
MNASSTPTLEQYFRTFYRGDPDLGYHNVAQYLIDLDTSQQYYDQHYLIQPEHEEEFQRIIRIISGALYSPTNHENSIFREYVVDDVCVMVEGSTRPIRIRMKHPDLPDEQGFERVFYIKKNSDFNPRLICSYLYHLFSKNPLGLWVNNKMIVTSEAKGTIGSRLPPGRLDYLMHQRQFLREVIRINVSVNLMMIADMFPKNYVIRQVLNKQHWPTWQIVPIDFDHAFLPENLDEPRLIIP